MKLFGLYKVKGDPQYGAAKISDDGSAILFKGKDGRYDTRNPTQGKITDLSEDALLTATRDYTLTEAAAAHEENRLPRWLDNSIFDAGTY